MYILSKLNLQWIFVVENTFTEDEGASTKKNNNNNTGSDDNEAVTWVLVIEIFI